MKNLIAKELKLSVGISSIIYLIIGILVEFAPNYPKYVPCLFICIGLFMIFKTGSVNKDLLYTACLPVRKSDTVKARVIIFAFSEVLQLILCIPLIFISKELKLTNNAGIDLNFAFIGLAFTFYAVFNFVFLTSFYKKVAGIRISSSRVFITPFSVDFPPLKPNPKSPKLHDDPRRSSSASSTIIKLSDGLSWLLHISMPIMRASDFMFLPSASPWRISNDSRPSSRARLLAKLVLPVPGAP